MEENYGFYLNCHDGNDTWKLRRRYDARRCFVTYRGKFGLCVAWLRLHRLSEKKCCEQVFGYDIRGYCNEDKNILCVEVSVTVEKLVTYGNCCGFDLGAAGYSSASSTARRTASAPRIRIYCFVGNEGLVTDTICVAETGLECRCRR